MITRSPDTDWPWAHAQWNQNENLFNTESELSSKFDWAWHNAGSDLEIATDKH